MNRRSHPLVKNTSIDDRRLLILEGVLAQVPFDGWTDIALTTGARQAGLTQGELDLLLPGGLGDLVALFGAMIDTKMQARIAKTRGFDGLRVREKIAFAVRARLEIMLPYREAVRRLCTWYALPWNWSLGAERLAQTVDVIWRAAGDTATDFNFYTKRALLAGVLKTTVLFWLADESPGCAASWDFLDRRIGEVLRLGQAIGRGRAGRDKARA
ncbi:MAG: COQ9 family protein [Pseudomonadota bacterium]|nr:COQ9 family protein [Pseudomonadota bacterium]